MSMLQARNEMIINADLSKIWEVITDINQLHKVNPGILKATGIMNKQGGTRTCEIDNNGRVGTMTERLIELDYERKTVWTIESDSMGMGKMLKNTRFCFNLEKLDQSRTRVSNETYYQPANLLVSLLNRLKIKKMISKTQGQILNNLKSITEGN